MAIEVSVVVPSHERPVRLRWLLAALEEQTLPKDRWEVIVCHDSGGEETEQLLTQHPLAARGVLRHLSLQPGAGHAAHKRNLAWRAARAPLIAFTDDDCRPDPHWLEELLAAAQAAPGGLIQGRTLPDPEELAVLRGAPHARTQNVDPPSPWAPTCNIAYPRGLLERLDGFDERLRGAGEDTDLALRARALGARDRAAPAAITYHAVEAPALPGAVRAAWRWRVLPAVVARHPEMRPLLPARIFWRWSHAWLGPALAGAILARRHPVLALLALPWLVCAWPARGEDARGRMRSVSELPGRAALDAAEVATLAYGSVRHRTLLL